MTSLNLVGRPEAIDAVAAELGNAQQKLQQVQMLPVFIGIGLRGTAGIYPVVYSRLPCRIEAGTGRWAADYGADPWAYRQYRQAVLVYAAERQPGAARAGDSAVSGGGRAKIGGDFVATLTQGDGLSWIAYGIFITAIPLLTVGILARACWRK